MNNLQQKYMEFQMYEDSLGKIQEQLEQLDENLLEINHIKSSLDDISRVNKGENILCPLSSGVFVRAKIEDTSDFLVNVGSNVVVKKNLEETKGLMDSQREEIEESKERLTQRYNEYYSKYEELRSELSQMVD